MNCGFSDEQVNCSYVEANVRIKELQLRTRTACSKANQTTKE